MRSVLQCPCDMNFGHTLCFMVLNLGPHCFTLSTQPDYTNSVTAQGCTNTTQHMFACCTVQQKKPI